MASARAARPAGPEDQLDRLVAQADAVLLQEEQPPRLLVVVVDRLVGLVRARRLVHVPVGPLEQRRLREVDQPDGAPQVVLVLVDLAAQDERRDVEGLRAEDVLVDVDRPARGADRDRAELEEQQAEQATGVQRVRVARQPGGARRSCRSRVMHRCSGTSTASQTTRLEPVPRRPITSQLSTIS